MSQRTGLMLIFITAIVSGFSIFINGFGVKGFDSSVFTFSKNIVVALFLLAIILGLGKWKDLKNLTRLQWTRLIGIGLVGGSIPFLLFFKGLQMTSGTTSAFIHKTLFIYVAVFALLFLKERLSKGLFLGAVLLLTGNYLMLRPDFSLSVGHVLIFAATLFWAVENTWAKHTLKEVSGSVVAFGRMFFGSLFILLFLAFTGKLSLVWSMSGAQYGWIGLTSILLLLFVFTYYNGLASVKVSTATSILALGSPITTLLAVVFRNTPLSVFQLLGIIAIGAGIASILLWRTPVIQYERS